MSEEIKHGNWNRYKSKSRNFYSLIGVSGEAALLLVIALTIALFAGEPDLSDSITAKVGGITLIQLKELRTK